MYHRGPLEHRRLDLTLDACDGAFFAERLGVRFSCSVVSSIASKSVTKCETAYARAGCAVQRCSVRMHAILVPHCSAICSALTTLYQPAAYSSPRPVCSTPQMRLHTHHTRSALPQLREAFKLACSCIELLVQTWPLQGQCGDQRTAHSGDLSSLRRAADSNSHMQSALQLLPLSCLEMQT